MQNQQTQGNEQLAKQGVISANSLQYNLSPDLTVTTSRTKTSQFFQNQSYSSSSTMVCILNTGSSFIYGPNTTLVLDVKNSGTQAFSFGDNGAATNLINRITVMTRSGVVLERIDSSNVLSSIKMDYEHDYNWVSTTGALAGVSSPEIVAGTTKRFIIPMSLISGLFAYENLLPAALMSGLRIEIVLASPITSLRTTAEVTPDYQITGCRIECDSYQLTDSIVRSLNESAASSGLEVVFKTYFTTVGTRTTSNLNLESRRACSRALAASYKEQPPRTSYLTNPMSTTAISATYGPTSVQFRAGSLYFPNSVISGSNPIVTSPEIQCMALEAFNVYNTPNSSNALADSYGSHSVIAVSLERSSMLELSGIPLSNSRTLCLNATFSDVSAPNFNSYLFLEYASLARVFISNATVEV